MQIRRYLLIRISFCLLRQLDIFARDRISELEGIFSSNPRLTIEAPVEVCSTSSYLTPEKPFMIFGSERIGINWEIAIKIIFLFSYLTPVLTFPK